MDEKKSGEQLVSEAAAAARREYYKAWRAKNPDKIRERNRRYWERRAIKQLAGKTGEKL